MKRSAFFAFGLAVLTLINVSPATSAEWATLKGVFHFGDMSTKIPSRKKLVPNKDIQVCCRTTLLDESLIVNNDNRGVANVVIWVYKPTRIHPEANMPPATPMRIDNVNCRFHPHVAAVQTGRDLVIGNLDPVGHNCLIHFMRNPGVNPLIPQNGQQTIRLAKAEFLPVSVSCSIHPWMRGYLLVQDHPYMAVTDNDGKFTLRDLPAEPLTLKVWHEKLGYVQLAHVDGREEIWKKGKYEIDLTMGNRQHTYSLSPSIFEK